jgi:tol-pal system protein YbgF
MVMLPLEARLSRVPVLAAVLLLGAGICLNGCGPTEETLEDEQWEAASAPSPSQPVAVSPPPAVPPAPPLPGNLDSLMRANLILQGQVDALTAETRRMRGRIAELETRFRETPTAPPAAPAPVSPSSDLKAAYAEALDQFMKRNYQSAIQQFEGILQSNRGNDLADNCTYWIGESYYALRNHSEAIRQFERVLEYPASGKKPYAQLMIGNAQMALGNRAAARAAYNAVVSSYPNSPLVSKAEAKLARLR